MKHLIPDHLTVVSSDVRSLLGGSQLEVKFPNGYGASVVRHSGSYGHGQGLYELAVLDEEGHLTYDTPVTSDVLGRLTVDDVGEALVQVAELSR